MSYNIGEVRFTRELFASHPENVIAAEFTASKPGMVTFDLRIIRQAGMPIQERWIRRAWIRTFTWIL